MSTILSCNSQFTAGNIHFFTGYLAFVTAYNKTRHNTGSDKLIARFLPPRLARIVIMYLTLVLPLLRTWAPEIFHDASQIQTFDNQFFVKSGRPMQSQEFTIALYDATSEGLNVGLGLADWRQVIKAIFRKIIGMDIDEDDEEESVIDNSFGHSRNVGDAHYGLTYDALPNMSSPMFRKNLILAQRLFRIFQLDDPKHELEPEQPTGISETDRKLVSLEDKVDRLLSTFEAKQHLVEDSFEKRVIEHVMPNWQDRLQNSIHDLILNGIPWNIVGATRVHIPPADPYAIHVHASRINAIRQIYGDGSSFKSPEQATAFEAVLQRKHHVIAILPTGGGKSFLFNGPCLIEKKGTFR